MAERKAFLIRVDRDLLDAVQRWANDDLRSLNAQIEFLLRRALRDSGRARGSALPTRGSSPRGRSSH
jgi:hypothetical protein